MVLKLIIFDFDGTIADTFPLILQIFNQFKADYNLEDLTSADIENFRNQEIWEIIKQLKIPIIKVPFLDLKFKQELMKNLDKIEVFKDIDKIILQLKKQHYALGIVSSNSKTIIQKFLIKRHLQAFDFIQESNLLKGKAKVIKQILREYNLQPEEVVYLGDETRDIEACRQAGINIISVSWGYQTARILQKHQPDYLVQKPKEILDIIKQFKK